MSEYMRHIGRIKNSDQRCVVVFMQIPGLEDHALVVNTESLPPRFEQHLMEVLESSEGQSAQDLGTVMSRRLMPESQRDVLNEFHQSGYLRREPVDNIIMLPRPNMPFVLRDVLIKMGKNVPMRQQPLPQTASRSLMKEIYENTGASNNPVNSHDALNKFNPYANNQGATSAAHSLGVARSILIDAEDLEMAAKQKREQAYQMAPELRPDPYSKLLHEASETVTIPDTKQTTAKPKRKGPGRPRRPAAASAAP